MSTFPRLARRYPTLDRARIDHTYGLDFDFVFDLEIIWLRTGVPPTPDDASGLSLLGLVGSQ